MLEKSHRAVMKCWRRSRKLNLLVVCYFQNKSHAMLACAHCQTVDDTSAKFWTPIYTLRILKISFHGKNERLQWVQIMSNSIVSEIYKCHMLLALLNSSNILRYSMKGFTIRFQNRKPCSFQQCLNLWDNKKRQTERK